MHCLMTLFTPQPQVKEETASAEVSDLLTSLGLQEYASLFGKEGIDDIATLRKYKESELKDIGMKV
jgi:hypothetical protein